MRRACLLVLVGLGCGADTAGAVNNGDGQGGPLANDDTVPPVIVHNPINDAQVCGLDVAVTATVTDAGGAPAVIEVVYSREDSVAWTARSFLPGGSADAWAATIPGDDVQSGGMWYYLRAIDDSGNESQMPEDGESDAYHFRINQDTGSPCG